MQVNVHSAKTQLSRLIDAAEAGEEVVIARAGTPAVRLVPIGSGRAPRRLGGLAGRVTVPNDFDTMFADEIAGLFGARPR